MTREEAKAKQDEIVASGFKLSYWYGTECEKCCGVYPKFRTGTYPNDNCWYECEVCGKADGSREYAVDRERKVECRRVSAGTDPNVLGGEQ